MQRDYVTEEQLMMQLKNCDFFTRAEAYDSLSSTNDRALLLAKNGAPEGTLVLASRQTAGRGRMGRHFYSPDACGLYMSLILRPDKHNCNTGFITACAAVAAWQAVYELTGVSVHIKWVNDLYMDGKKLCGILAEGCFDEKGKLSYVIVGIGMNLFPPTEGYHEEIRGKTTSLFEIAPHICVDPVLSCTAVTQHFGALYKALPDNRFLETYRAASCVLGRTVFYEKDGKNYVGKAILIDDCARLVVEHENGASVTLETGEINLLRPVL